MTTKLFTAALALAVLSSCGDDSATPSDARPDGTGSDSGVPGTYRQVEFLARPGIAEALLINNAFLAGYNATAPTFAGVPAATLDMVVGEAKTVLKAIYLGACLINGAHVPPFTTLTGVQPAGAACHAVGGAILDGSGNLTAASMTAAQNYADRVFGQFIPDVMRIDLGVASTYQNLCSAAAAGVPLLCGGRLLNDDTIDVTYDYLINGAGTPKDTPIVSRLVSDGVTFSTTEAENSLNRTSAAFPANGAQGHPAISNTVFPYSGTPL